jgi:multimeric flavodoxin WrbA
MKVFLTNEDKMKLVIISGSPHASGSTIKALDKYGEYLVKIHGITEISKHILPVGLKGCQDCKKCNIDCNIKDECQNIFNDIENADYVLFGSPVYLDMPTAQMIAFLTRLNCKAENTNREFFKGKKALCLATAFCSGTKTVIHTMFGALEMLGFTIEGRSSREYIQKWSDKKVRGGMTYMDSIFIE